MAPIHGIDIPWVHEVDFSYHMLRLRYQLMVKGLQRLEEQRREDAYSSRCASRKVTGCDRLSLDSDMSVSREKRTLEVR